MGEKNDAIIDFIIHNIKSRNAKRGYLEVRKILVERTQNRRMPDGILEDC